MTDEADHIVSNHVLNSLLMDTCYFLQEAFLCSLKMRLSVSFTLFRKPFSEILIILMRLLLEKDFIAKFNNEDNFNPTALPAENKKVYLEIINAALNNMYRVDDLYEYLFDKSHGDNLYNIGNHAIHLYTGKNPAIKTEKQNLNFIFSNKEDINAQWEYIYTIIPMLLSFLVEVAELCVMNGTDVPDGIFKRRFNDRYQMKKRCHVE
jgi:hypothetical protein